MKIPENQIIVVSSDRSKFAKEIVGDGLAPVYCVPDQTALYEVKDRSGNILVILTDETEDTVRRLASYLTILCIDEEKNLFIYGKKNLVDIIKEKVPSLYIICAGYLFMDTFGGTINEIHDFISRERERQKPAILFVDVDDEYINRIKPLLTRHFDVFSSLSGNGYDISARIRFCSVVVLSTSLTLPVVSFTAFFVEIMKKRLADPDFAMYFLSSNSDEQTIINTLAVNSDGQDLRISPRERGFISISKDGDLEKTADFLIKRAGR